jgi:Lysylphosphatidylglycerol synthase TM region
MKFEQHISRFKSEFGKVGLRALYPVFKWFIILLAYGYLTYKLVTFDKYYQVLEEWNRMPLTRVWWLVIVFLFMPLNWFFEAVKWKRMISVVQHIGIMTSFKAVVVGVSTGFFTPNRIGELVGRVIYMDEPNKKSGITLSLVNSITQNMVMAIVGIPACVLFFSFTQAGIESNMASNLLFILIFLILFLLFYFALPKISEKLMDSDLSEKFKSYLSCLSLYSRFELLIIIAISMVRYVIFCTQFFCMLKFFGVDLSFYQALMAIPSNYLMVTFTPSVGFFEAAIRTSSAMLCIGAFSGKVVNIAIAGVAIWTVNFVIPMIVGTVLMLRVK